MACALATGNSAEAKLGMGWVNWATPDLDERLPCTAVHPEHALLSVAIISIQFFFPKTRTILCRDRGILANIC